MKIMSLMLLALVVGFTYIEGSEEMENENMKQGHVLTKDKKKIYFDHYENGHEKVKLKIYPNNTFKDKKETLAIEIKESLQEKLGPDFQYLHFLDPDREINETPRTGRNSSRK